MLQSGELKWDHVCFFSTGFKLIENIPDNSGRNLLSNFKLTERTVLNKYQYIVSILTIATDRAGAIFLFLFFFLVTVSEHLLAQYNAIKMLHSRVKMILEYAKAVKNGEIALIYIVGKLH